MRRSIRSSRSRWRAAQDRSTGALTRPRSARSAAIALLAFACAAAFATTALAAAPAPSESLVIFEGQLNGHQVSAVTLRTEAHTFRVVLTDGRIVRVMFPAAQKEQLTK